MVTTSVQPNAFGIGTLLSEKHAKCVGDTGCACVCVSVNPQLYFQDAESLNLASQEGGGKLVQSASLPHTCTTENTMNTPELCMTVLNMMFL